MRIGVRSVVDGDRWRIRDWRNSERIRSVSVDDAEIAEDVHAAWFDRLLAERSDQVLIATGDDEPIGVVSLEHLDVARGIGGWGCYLGVTDVPPGVGAVLPVIGLGFGFDGFGVRRMVAQVLATNRNMRGIHRRLGIVEEGVLRRHARRRDGSAVDVIAYGVLRDEWPGIRATAERLLPASAQVGLGDVLDGFAAGGVTGSGPATSR
jgi:RimJ/RimL family protein N-acetyltransferase